MKGPTDLINEAEDDEGEFFFYPFVNPSDARSSSSSLSRCRRASARL